jgi:hypothetical protein
LYSPLSATMSLRNMEAHPDERNVSASRGRIQIATSRF